MTGCECRPACTCAQILKDPSWRCQLHPDVKPKTREEQSAFAHAWDAKVEANQ